MRALGGGMLLTERDGTPVGAHAFVRQADEAIRLSMATRDEGGHTALRTLGVGGDAPRARARLRRLRLGRAILRRTGR